MQYGDVVEFDNQKQRVMGTIADSSGFRVRLSISGLQPTTTVKLLEHIQPNTFKVGDSATVFNIPRAEKLQYPGGWSNHKQEFLAPRGPFTVQKVNGPFVQLEQNEWFLYYHLKPLSTYDVF